MYPGWLVLPSGEEREIADSGAPTIGKTIIITVRFTGICIQWKRLSAIRELMWRREILLQPISSALESAAESALTLDRLPSPHS